MCVYVCTYIHIQIFLVALQKMQYEKNILNYNNKSSAKKWIWHKFHFKEENSPDSPWGHHHLVAL